MKYVALIYTDPERAEAADPAARKGELEQYMEFSRTGREQGEVLGGNELAPVTTATRVQVIDGATIVTDGPYAETKEQLGGYYVLDCDSIDEAVEVAARIPGAAHGAVEVRPVHEEVE